LLPLDPGLEDEPGLLPPPFDEDCEDGLEFEFDP
jgi:hypothetical protein